MQRAAPWFRLPESNAIASQLPGENARVVIVGAGLAGCNLARELAERRVNVQVLETGKQAAAAASGNFAGIVKPFVTRVPGAASAFYQRAFSYFNRIITERDMVESSGFRACSVLQLVHRSYEEQSTYKTLDAVNASLHAGVPIDSAALLFESAGWLDPKQFCTALLQHPNIELKTGINVVSLAKTTHGWSVEAADGSSIDAGLVVLATGTGIANTAQTAGLPIEPARGQVSRFAISSGGIPRCVINGSHYVIPATDSVLVGATFERGVSDSRMLDRDHQSNLAGLHRLLPLLQVESEPCGGFAAVRATTPDRFPVVGPMPDMAAYKRLYASLRHGRKPDSYPQPEYVDKLYVIGGFGSRGIVSAPYCARLLAEQITLASSGSSLDQPAIPSQADTTLLHPARFIVRELKRGS